MTDTTAEPVEPEHSDGYDTDVPDVELLEPDYEAEETDEVDEVVMDEDPTDEEPV